MTAGVADGSPQRASQTVDNGTTQSEISLIIGVLNEAVGEGRGAIVYAKLVRAGIILLTAPHLAEIIMSVREEFASRLGEARQEP